MSDNMPPTLINPETGKVVKKGTKKYKEVWDAQQKAMDAVEIASDTKKPKGLRWGEIFTLSKAVDTANVVLGSRTGSRVAKRASRELKKVAGRALKKHQPEVYDFVETVTDPLLFKIGVEVVAAIVAEHCPLCGKLIDILID